MVVGFYGNLQCMSSESFTRQGVNRAASSSLNRGGDSLSPAKGQGCIKLKLDSIGERGADTRKRGNLDSIRRCGNSVPRLLSL
jgi:hypothetical protein